MLLNISGTVLRVEDKVSKKGNAYTVIELVQDESRYQYFNSMVDNSVEFDKEGLVGKNVDLTLDYNPRYKSFKIIDVK